MFVAFGDTHFPEQDDKAISCLLKALRHLQPDIAISLGDLIDCKSFSTHPKDSAGDTPYNDEIAAANTFLDEVQEHSDRLVLVEGNHEHRIERYANRSRAGASVADMLSPRRLLTAGRDNVEYISYGVEDGTYAHYALSPYLACVHGWSYADNATKQHLKLSQGVSIIHGHTHRADYTSMQSLWRPGHKIEAMSAGCLCRLVPNYNVGTPNTWTNGFVVGYIGRESRDHTIYFVNVRNGYCVLPGGKEIHA